MDYKSDRKRADEKLKLQINTLNWIYSEKIKYKITNEKEDWAGTDLQINIDGKIENVSLRYREAKYEYDDITIRAWKKSGKETEIDKLKNKIGDKILYVWEDGRYIYLKITNKFINYLNNSNIQYNKDNTTGFKKINIYVIKNSDAWLDDSGDWEW